MYGIVFLYLTRASFMIIQTLLTSTQRSLLASLWKWSTRYWRKWKSFPKGDGPCTTNLRRYLPLPFASASTHSLKQNHSHFFLFFFLIAIRRLLPVSAGWSAAEEQVEPASGECGEGDEPAQCQLCSRHLRTGRRAAESQRGVEKTCLRGPFPLYPDQRWGGWK